MTTVQLIHNPGAGEGKYSGKELTELIQSHGYECRYFSTKKKGWKDFSTDADLVVAAGGDGTVRKVVRQLLKRSLADRPARLAVLPAGTANNIATTLGIGGDPQKSVASWKKGKLRPFDVGRIINLQDHGFFLESIGCGVFPRLIREMKKFEVVKGLSPEESLDEALKTLHRIILSYEPRPCKVSIDGRIHQGNYILAEILNTSMIGPNLRLSPASDPSDGKFEILLVTEAQREAFARHVAARRHGKKRSPGFKVERGTSIILSWEGEDVHVDDELVETSALKDLRLRVNAGALNMLLP